MDPGQPYVMGSDDDGSELGSPAFDTVRRGFAPDQVSEYLSRVAASALALESRLGETRSELLQARRERDEARQALQAETLRDPLGGVSERVAELIRNFDEHVARLRRSAETEADETLVEVRAEADRILTRARAEGDRIVTEALGEAQRARAAAQAAEEEAQARAGRLIEEAQQEADRVSAGLAANKESTLDEFREIRDRALTALSEIQLIVEKGGVPSEQVVIVEDAEQGTAADTFSPWGPDA